MDGFLEEETRALTIDGSTEPYVVPRVNHHRCGHGASNSLHHCKPQALAGIKTTHSPCLDGGHQIATLIQHRLLCVFPIRRELQNLLKPGTRLTHATSFTMGAACFVARALQHSSFRVGWRSDLHPLGVGKHPPPFTLVIPLGSSSFNSVRLSFVASLMH